MLNRALTIEELAALRPLAERPLPPLRLHLACGHDWIFGGVVNIDCRNLLPPAGVTFLRADARDLSDMFADGCASEIWVQRLPGCFAGADAELLRSECLRLLAPGGVLHAGAFPRAEKIGPGGNGHGP